MSYFNGERIGETRGSWRSRDYKVAGQYVRSGPNVLAIRLIGYDSFDNECTGIVLPFRIDMPKL